MSKQKPNNPRPWLHWYSTAAWKKIRARQLKMEPLCRMCKQMGIITAANTVDHIIDHKGDTELFYNTDNLQSLCPRCHSEKTMAENPVSGSTMIPKWMPFSEKPITLICGPIASGKSTYVDEKKKDGDLVVDLDQIASTSGFNLWEATKEQRDAVIRKRNSIIANYIKLKNNYKKCWIIASASCPSHREFWKKRGAEIVCLDADKEICRERVLMRGRGEDYERRAVSVINNWGKFCGPGGKRELCKLCNEFGCDENGIVESWK